MFRSLLALGCLAILPLAAVADDGPAQDIPEFEVLAHFVGEFELTATGGTLGLTSGESKGEWILGGQFVELNGTMTSADGSTTIEVMTLYTYDIDDRVYRAWTFTANGTAMERTGAYDTATQTLTFESFNSRAVSDFSNPEESKFTIISIAADGTETVINEGVGRRKE